MSHVYSKKWDKLIPGNVVHLDEIKLSKLLYK